MNKLRMQWEKNREALLYLFFGVLTTAVNYLVYVLVCWALPSFATTLPNLIAWVLSVLFAYVTNRTWVFRSAVCGAAACLREMVSFFGARVATLVLETVILWLCVDMLALPNLPIKLAANVLVIVLNYVLSKVWIFKHRPN